MAERLVLEANGEHGLATCSLRPHLIWGPGDTHIIPMIAQRAQQGQLRRIGDGKNLVDLTFVDNAANAHLLAAQKLQLAGPVAGKAFFISDGAPVNLWDWVADLLRRLDLPPVTKSISYNRAYTLATILETAWRWLPLPGEPRLTRFAVSNFAKSHYFDLTAARRDLGYVPLVTNEEGLRRTVQWWQEREKTKA